MTGKKQINKGYRDHQDYQKIQNERLKEMMEKLEEGVKDVFDSENYKNYLKTMGKFHNYSFNNSLLIYMQKPDATLVAGYNSWKKNFNRQVKKGAKAIRIFAPTKYKVTEEVDRKDKVTNTPVRDADGNVVKDKQEIEKLGFKVTHVFDVSDTEGERLPQLGVHDLQGNVEGYEILMEALKRSCPVPITFEDIKGDAKGYYSRETKSIAIQEGMSQLQTIKTMIHEMSHERLHDPDHNNGEHVERSKAEVQAESIASVVSGVYGLDTSEYSFGYIAGWAQDKEIQELKDSLQIIRNTSSKMIDDIDTNLDVIMKEKVNAMATDIDDMIHNVDPYEYRDRVDNREEAVNEIKEMLTSGGEGLDTIKSTLQEIAEEKNEYSEKAGILLSEVESMESKEGKKSLLADLHAKMQEVKATGEVKKDKEQQLE